MLTVFLIGCDSVEKYGRYQDLSGFSIINGKEEGYYAKLSVDERGQHYFSDICIKKEDSPYILKEANFYSRKSGPEKELVDRKYFCDTYKPNINLSNNEYESIMHGKSFECGNKDSECRSNATTHHSYEVEKYYLARMANTILDEDYSSSGHHYFFFNDKYNLAIKEAAENVVSKNNLNEVLDYMLEFTERKSEVEAADVSLQVTLNDEYQKAIVKFEKTKGMFKKGDVVCSKYNQVGYAGSIIGDKVIISKSSILHGVSSSLGSFPYDFKDYLLFMVDLPYYQKIPAEHSFVRYPKDGWALCDLPI